MWISLILLAFAQDAASHYEAGVEALRRKDADIAVVELTTCLSLEPERVDCAWELGWAHWLNGDWDKVVATWDGLGHPERDRHLPTARGNLEVQKMVAASAEGAPPTLAREGAASSVRLRAVGDVMLGTDFPAGYMPPNDGADLLDEVEDLLRDADLTFANLEGPLCDGGTTTKCGTGGNCYAFRSPTRYGDYVAQAGVDLASTANNHAEDFGVECRVQTEATLDQLGIAYSGRPGTIARVEHEGLRIAMIGFHTAPSGHHLNDHDTAMALIRTIAAEVDVLIVSFHGGAEGSKAIHVPRGRETFYGEDRGDLRVFAHGAVDNGADLILGHGPHVPRAMEIYEDRLIAYSLGNFATYGRFNLSGYLGVGLVLEVVLDDQGRFVSGRIIPTEQLGQGVPAPDPEGRAVDLVRKLSEEDFPSTGVVVAQDGTLGPR
ncbi:MAG TPA: CapA family protein [Myxococcota bacterium]|nr:CapA family protein [Myxococcota bacterium]